MKTLTNHGRNGLLQSCLAMMACLLAIPAGSQWADAQEGRLVFILDGSGSMWAELEGRTKIDVAKEVLSGLIKDLPAGVDVGLVVYGHRSKGDCRDVEEVVPVGPPDREGMIRKVQSIDPKGMTPIAYSVEVTAEKLRSLKGASTILLVSDGEETCKGDPCALVRKLRKGGLNFVMHVIGFSVSEKEKAQLECIANAGGGRYFDAKSAKEFQASAKKVTESVTVGKEPGKLELDKKAYLPLENVVVTFTARADYAETAWIGVVPSNVPHTQVDSEANDLAYEYVKKRITGTMTFQAPRLEGSYDLRMFNVDIGGTEVASVTFEVKGNLGVGQLKLDKAAYAPGETVNVHFTAGERFTKEAWVGLFTSDLPHAKSGPSDQHDLAYRYLEGTSKGVLSFKAPYELGTYDFRMFDTSDDDGEETASVTFTVAGGVSAGELRLEKSTFRPEEIIRVHFKASPTYQSDAWIGLIPSQVPHGTSRDADAHDLAYEYLEGKLEGTVEFRAPEEPGSYDIRMFDDSESDAHETATVSFIVTGKR